MATNIKVPASAAACQLPDTGFIRLPKILSIIPISRSTWWAWVASGKAPAGRKLGPRITAWKVEDIRKLIASHDA